MKKLFFIALIALMTGCAVFMSASDVAQQAYICMPVGEFQKLAGTQAQLEAMTANYTVYRIDEYSNIDGKPVVTGAKFFNFDPAGKLCEINSMDFRDDPHWGGGRRH